MKPAAAEPEKPSGEAPPPAIRPPATIPRLSRFDKEAIIRDNRALFVGLPRAITRKRGTILSRIRLNLIEAVGPDTLSQIIASGDSFLAVIFLSAQFRDHALVQLRGRTFTFEGGSIPVTIHTFGEHQGAWRQVWLIPGGWYTSQQERDETSKNRSAPSINGGSFEVVQYVRRNNRLTTGVYIHAKDIEDRGVLSSELPREPEGLGAVTWTIWKLPV